MPLKIYDTKEAVPEAQRAAALETKDGKFAVVEETDELGEKGKAALQAERDRADAAEKARKLAEKKADDLEREREARAKGISEEDLQRIRDDEAKARKPIEDENAALKAENRKLKLTDRVKALYLKHGGMPDRVEDAMLVLERRTDLGDKDGIVVLGEDGKPTAESIDEFLSKTFKAAKPWLYEGTGASGSGSLGSEGHRSGPPDPDVKGKTVAAKREMVAGAL
jgi:hypothetical protein